MKIKNSQNNEVDLAPQRNFSIKEIIYEDIPENKPILKKLQDISEYSKLLKNPKWQKKRLEIMQRDNFQCRLCQDAESTLNVHHKCYKNGNKPWEYEDEDLITLCEDCHEEVEILKLSKIHIQDIYSIKKFFSTSSPVVKLMVISSKDFACIKSFWPDGSVITGLNFNGDAIPVIIQALKKAINHG